MTLTFVLGNGVSRQPIELTTLRKYGKIYGCNALYRHFTPDVLVATDPGISTEIQKSGYALKHKFYTRKPLPSLGANPIVYNYTYSSGPVALTYASKSDPHTIYMLGFDLCGVNSKFNNVYADTEFYKKSHDGPTYFGSWIEQITEVVRSHPKHQYIRVMAENVLIPGAFNTLKNLSHIPITQFCSDYK